MSRKRIIAGVMTVAVISFASMVGMAQDKNQPANPPTAPAMGWCCPRCMPMRGASTAADYQAMMGRWTAQMKQMGMSAPMMMRCRMMMWTQVSPTDPSGILALRDVLELTQDQAKRLQAIADRARTDAAGVLSAEQKAKLEPIAGTPSTWMDMCRQMMDKWRAAGGQAPSGGWMCPWMMGAPAPTPPTQPSESRPTK